MPQKTRNKKDGLPAVVPRADEPAGDKATLPMMIALRLPALALVSLRALCVFVFRPPAVGPEASEVAADLADPYRQPIVEFAKQCAAHLPSEFLALALPMFCRHALYDEGSPGDAKCAGRKRRQARGAARRNGDPARRAGRRANGRPKRAHGSGKVIGERALLTGMIAGQLPRLPLNQLRAVWECAEEFPKRDDGAAGEETLSEATLDRQEMLDRVKGLIESVPTFTLVAWLPVLAGNPIRARKPSPPLAYDEQGMVTPGALREWLVAQT